MAESAQMSGVQQSDVSLESPFYGAGNNRPLNVQQAVQWAQFSDWALLPHVRYFRGVPDLFMQLLNAEALHETAARMKAFNEEDLTIAVDLWRHVALRLVFASRLVAGAGVSAAVAKDQ